MKASKLAVIVLAVVGVAALLWVMGGNAFARRREKQAEKAWVQSFGTLQDLLNRHPKTATNDTARRLEVLVKPLGLYLEPRTHDSVVAGARSSEQSRESEAPWFPQPAFLYLTAQLKKPEAAIDPPPPELKDFLAARSKDLHAVEAELLASPPPRWGFDPSDLLERQPIPNVYGLIRLQRALLAEALAESFGGNASAAGRALEASWKLNQMLREVPDLMCQIIALAIARMEAGALRKIDIDADLWRKRLAEHDFKQWVFDTELISLWPRPEKYRRLEEMEPQTEKNPFKRVETFLRQPYDAIVWAEVIDRMRLEYLRIRDSQPLSAGDVPERKAGAKNSSADVLASIQIPNLLNTFRRVDSFVLDAELTGKVLEARQLRQQNSLKWPDAIPGIERTRLPGARWIYAVSPGGTMTLSLSKEPHWDQGGLILPLRFTSS